jgi:hypothetical protein
MAKAAAVAPDLAGKLRKWGDFLFQSGVPGREAYDTISAAASKLIHATEDAVGSADPVDVTEEVSRMSKALRHADPDQIIDWAANHGLDTTSRKLAATDNPFQLMQEVLIDLKDRYVRSGFKAPSWLKGANVQKIASEIRDAINRGVERGNLPVPRFVASDQIAGRVAAGKQRILSWMARAQEGLLLLRGMNTEMRANQTSFLEYLHTRRAGSLADLDGAELAAQRTLGKEASPGPEHIELFGETTGIRHDLDLIRAKQWDTGQRLTGTRWWNNVSFEEISTWVLSEKGEEGLWATLRKPLEDRQRFFDRMRRTIEKSRATSDDPKVLEQIAKAQDQVRKWRKRLGRNWLDNDGVPEQAYFLTDDGTNWHAVNQHRYRQVIADRNKIDRYETAIADPDTDPKKLAQLQDEMDDFFADYGSETMPEVAAKSGLPDDWKKLLRQAATEDGLFGLTRNLEADVFQARKELARTKPNTPEFKRKLRELNAVLETLHDGHETITAQLDEVAFDMSDGTFAYMQRRLQDLGESLKFNQAVKEAKVLEHARQWQRLTPAEKQLFDDMILARQDLGHAAPIDELKQWAPVRMHSEAKLTPEVEANVAQLLNKLDGMRVDMLRNRLRTGGITEADFTALVRPYAPRVYENLLLSRLDVGVPSARGTGVSTLRGANLGEFELRRHPSRWTGTVSVRGRGFRTETFDSQAEAMGWVRRNHGIKGKQKKTKGGGLRGRTDLGDAWRVAAPLGESFVQALEPMRVGKGLISRLETLVSDLHLLHFLQMMDRPFANRVLTDKDYDQWLKHSDVRLGDPSQWTQLKGNRFGALSNKWVHNDVLVAYERFTDGYLLSRRLTRWMADRTADFGFMGNMAKIMASGVVKTAAVTKDLIVGNGIIKSLSVLMGNLIGDQFLYARAIAPDLLTSADGLGAMDEAIRVVLFSPLEGVATEKAAPLVRALIAKGVLDETAAELAVPKTLRNFMVEEVLGPSRRYRDVAKSGFGRLLDSFGGWKGKGSVKKLFGLTDTPDPQLARMRSKLQAMEDFAASPRINELPKGAQRRFHEARHFLLREVESAATTNRLELMKQGLKELYTWSASLPSGRFGERESLFRNLYGRLNNVSRLGAAIHLARRGMPLEKVIETVRGGMQTYSQVPRFVKDLSRNFLGSPILSYSYEHVRLLGHQLFNNFSGLAGTMSGFAGANFVSMAMMGVDPTFVLDAMQSTNKSRPIWTLFSSRAVVPMGDGLGFVGFPGVDPWAPALMKPSSMQPLLREDMRGKNFLAQTGAMVKQYATSFLFGNPVYNAVFSFASGRSPFSGDLNSNPSSLLGENAASFWRIAVPPFFPGGSYGHQIARAMDSPPNQITGRKSSVANAGIRAMTGFDLDGINTAPIAGQTVETIGQTLMPGNPVPLRARPELPYSEDDVVGMIYARSAQFDPRNDSEMDVHFGTFRNELRSAVALAKDEDAEVRKVGRERVRSLMKEWSQFRTDRALIELGDKPLEEQVEALARMYSSTKEQTFLRFSLPRKVSVIRDLHRVTKNDGLTISHIIATLVDTQGNVKGERSLARIKEGQRMLDNYLRTVPQNQRAGPVWEYFSTLTNHLRMQAFQAEFRFHDSVDTDESRLEASRILRGDQ